MAGRWFSLGIWVIVLLVTCGWYVTFSGYSGNSFVSELWQVGGFLCVSRN